MSAFRRAISALKGHPKRIAAVVMGVLATGALALALVNIVYARVNHFTPFKGDAGGKLRIEISSEAKQDLGHLIDGYLESHPELMIRYVIKDPDVVIAPEKRPGFKAVEVVAHPSLVLKAGSRSITLREKRSYWFMTRRGGLLLEHDDAAVAGLERFLAGHQDSLPTASMNAVGDIVPARHVAEKMAEHGVEYPFKKVAPHVSDADIVFASLECSLSDRYDPPYSGMKFISPESTVKGLKMLGLNVVSLANNHSTDFGVPAFTDTLKLLEKNRIKYAGGGYDYGGAHTPAVLEAGGKKFAFLAYNSIRDSIDATDSEPGVAWISMDPYYPDDPEHIAKVEGDIRKARESCDFVIASFHWSREDVYYPAPSMKNLTYAALGAGADMVLGSHPHTIQPIEYHDGKFIAYSMGNFVFDQMQRDQTREGFFIKCSFVCDTSVTLTRIEMVPYRIYDYSQPVVLKGKAGQKVLDRVLEISGRGAKD